MTIVLAGCLLLAGCLMSVADRTTLVLFVLALAIPYYLSKDGR
jgi:hypothetical protein